LDLPRRAVGRRGRTWRCPPRVRRARRARAGLLSARSASRCGSCASRPSLEHERPDRCRQLQIGASMARAVRARPWSPRLAELRVEAEVDEGVGVRLATMKTDPP
jgi:hypothetical protein